MAVAATRGLGDPGSLEQAERLKADDNDDFEQLPSSCTEAADVLEAEREMFGADGVFPGKLIDALLAGLRDADAESDEVAGGKGDDDEAAREELIRRHWHVG